MDDWEAHLTTVFPEVRLKRYIEMRGADGGPWNMICALPALWVGLVYNKEVQTKCMQLISSWSQEDRDYLRAEV
jgi:glutamate--cysteine ligase